MSISGLCSARLKSPRSKGVFGRLLKGVMAVVAIVVVSVALGGVSAKAASTPAIDVWWPVNGAAVNGTQPFKAVLEGVDVNSYYMFWEVDGGRYNVMPTNNQDSPHKEADVDLSGWNWESSGNYEVTFIAQDLQGQEITRTSVSIHVQNGTVTQASTPVTEAPAASAPTPAVTSAPAPVQISASSDPTIQVGVPTNGATVNGTEQFQASLADTNPDSYYMFWEVGTGQYNQMATNGPGKSAFVNVSSWNWEPSGDYEITFVAQNLQGQEIARTSVSIHVENGTVAQASMPVTPAPAASAPTPAVASAPAADVSTNNNIGSGQASTPVSGSDVFAGAKFYVDPDSLAASAVSTLQGSDPLGASLIDTIAQQSTGVWFGDWDANVENDVNAAVTAAANTDSVPLLVAYNIPDRDCGGYSAGGATDAAQYAQWIQQFAAGIDGRKAAVVLEPDSLSVTSCLSASQLQERFAMLSSAVNVLKAAGASVYIEQYVTKCVT